MRYVYYLPRDVVLATIYDMKKWRYMPTKKNGNFISTDNKYYVNYAL